MVIGACGASLVMLAGWAGPRMVFLPAADAPVRAGPNLSGQVYVWTGSTGASTRVRTADLLITNVKPPFPEICEKPNNLNGSNSLR